MSKVICLVDDEPDIRAIVATLLKSKGYEVHEAANGVEGMKIIQMHKPDLAILDLMMPGMSGLEMCKRLRESDDFASLPILVLSAIARDSDKPSEYWAAGLQSDDFIRKPFEPLDLLGRIEFLLRRGSYVSHGGKQTSPGGAALTPVPGAAGGGAAKTAQLSPEEVVKTFIESWNTQDFETEYDCLGHEMRYNMRKPDYMSRRRATWVETNGKNITQKYVKTIGANVADNNASVLCLRQNKHGERTENKKETYQLQKTDSGWKIIRVRSQPM